MVLRRSYPVIIALLLAWPLHAQQEMRRYVPVRDSLRLQTMAKAMRKREDRSRMRALDLARDKGWMVKKQFSDGRFIELQGLDEHNMPVYYETHNARAAASTSTRQLISGGSLGLNLDGNGLKMGIWDAGAVRSTHQEFSGRVTQRDDASELHFHASHVAGTLAAQGFELEAKGMASAANLDAYDWSSDGSEMAQAAANGLLISNHSYGMLTGWTWDSEKDEWAFYGDTTLSKTEDYKFGFYNNVTQSTDQIAFNAPYYLIVKSAGNDRNDGPGFDNGSDSIDGDPNGFDCIGVNGTAKNILTVGAVGDLPEGYIGAPEDVVMTSFSSWGPCDDGRIKPDICGNGYALYSSMEDADNSYASMSGTSMSSPNVAGSLLLLQEHFQERWGHSMRAATLKGLAIHTADEAGPAEGPDYMYGWGLLNARSAAELISERTTKSLLEELHLETGVVQSYELIASGDEPLVVSISWTDLPGTPVVRSIDPRDIMLVNDLDMKLVKDQETHLPYCLDVEDPQAPATKDDNDLDNLEKIVISNPSGRYTLQVSHEGPLTNGAQDYSLIVSGIELASGNVDLLEGWNLLSFPAIILNGSARSFFNDLLEGGKVEKIQDEAGNAIEYVVPIGWVDGIGDLDARKGYKIKASLDVSVDFYGTPLPDPAILDLSAGWNIISYPWSSSSATSTIFADLIASGFLQKVQDEAGNAIEEVFPIGWVDNIYQLEAGEGYKIKVSAPLSLSISNPDSFPQ